MTRRPQGSWRLAAVGLLWLTGATDAQEAASNTRPVDIAVEVLSQDGTAISGVPVLPRQVKFDPAAMRTNEKGNCSGFFSVEASATELTLIISPGHTSRASTTIEGIEELRTLLSRWSFARRYVVPLEAERNLYQLKIIARPAILVTGRLVNARGEPQEASLVIPRDVEGPVGARVEGRPGGFAVGIPKGARQELFFSTHDGEIICKEVPASDVDFNIGDVVIPDRVRNATVRIVVKRPLPSDPRVPDTSGVYLVELISNDGRLVFAGTARNLRPSHPEDDSLPFAVPAGLYYVVLGSLLTDTDRIAPILSAARDGVDLLSVGITQVFVTAGEETPILLDRDSALTAMAKIAASHSK